MNSDCSQMAINHPESWAKRREATCRIRYTRMPRNDRKRPCELPLAHGEREEEALNCPCSLRFEIERGHVVLRIYSNWQYGIGENGKWFEHVDGSVIETIRWEEHWRYKASRSKVVSRKMGVIISPCYDYIPDATPWDILFGIDNLPEEWGVTVEPLEYRIDVLDVD